MKFKKIALAVSCTVAALALSSCSSSKAEHQDNPVNGSAQSYNKKSQEKVAPVTVVKTKAATKVVVAPKEDIATHKTLAMSANMSYITGYESGKNISLQGLNLNGDDVVSGFQDALTNAKPKLSEYQIQKSMLSLKDKMVNKQLKVADTNKLDSKEFIDKISTISNITKVNDDVYFQIIKQGEGKKPNSDSTVTIAYKGTTPAVAYKKDISKFQDILAGKMIGETFDSSDNATFPLTNLIQCWKDAIPQLSTGTTVILYCSPDVAYGTRAPASIGPNQALSFEITLKSFT